jgi:hypothetical protein
MPTSSVTSSTEPREHRQPREQHSGRHAPAGAIAFFLSIARLAAQRPSRLVNLAHLGAVTLTIGTLTLGINVSGKDHAMQENINVVDRRLWTIVGNWTTSGSVIGEPAVPVVGTDIYEVLPGGHFLVHHVDVTVGSHEVRAIEIIGEPDPASGGYLARSFDNEGNAEVMHVSIDAEGVFHFAGGSEIAPAAQPKDATTGRVRSTLTIADDRRTMHALWERSEDGTSWQPWMDMTFTKSDVVEHG